MLPPTNYFDSNDNVSIFFLFNLASYSTRPLVAVGAWFAWSLAVNLSERDGTGKLESK